MKRLIKKTLLGIFGGALIVGSLAGCAQRGHDSWQSGAMSPDMHARIVDKVGSRLDLDAAQKEKLATLVQTLQTERTRLRGAGDPRAEFKALFAGDKLDQAAAKKLVDEKTTAVQLGSPAVIAAAADFFNNLKPEQQKKVRDFMERGRRWNMHG